MTIHLLKLAVGVENVTHLRQLQQQRIRRNGELRHVTRFMPKKAEEILNGGSIYWVVKNFIRVRQLVVDFRSVNDGKTHIKKCAFILDKSLILTVPTRRRPHQGWRYLSNDNVPEDLASGLKSYGDMPSEMVEELRQLGLL